MKRSEINGIIHHMEALCAANGIHLPFFCSLAPDKLASLGQECDEIRDNMLGWDITDYGLGDFSSVGLSLVTLRNGNVNMRDRYQKPYAEKLLMLMDGQYSPMHFHWNKMEDIINRGGGTVLMRVYNASDDDGLADTDVTVSIDGRRTTVPAGTRISLSPGDSMTVTQRLYHDFALVPGTGDAILGEVSMCNDDVNDNRFFEPVGRFPAISEDEPAYRLLCCEYHKAKI